MEQVQPPYVFGPFRLDPARRALDVSGAPVALSSRAFDLLQFLIEARDRVVGREELMARVWPGVVVESSNLTVQMSALRRALGDTGDEPHLIATIPGRGYRFIGRLQSDAPHAETVPVPEHPLPPHAAADQSRKARSRSLWFAVPAAIALLVLGGVLVPFMMGSGPGTKEPPRLSIVVMPFRNLSDEPGKDYLADGISDDLTTDLSHIPGSLVIARATADAYKGKPVPAGRIGRELNVRYMLEGSVRAAGSTLRINAQLIDTVDGTHVWSDRFDTSASQLLDAQGDIVHRIASALDVALVDAEVARAARERPNDPDALDLFNRARLIMDRAVTLEDYSEAQNLLERTLKAQPDYTEALATLGYLLVLKELAFEYPTQPQDDDEAHRVIDHALALAPHSPSVLAARGRLLESDGRCDEAQAAFNAALATDPNNVVALWGVGLCAWAGGAPDKVAGPLAKTLRIDPQGPGLDRRVRLLGMAALFAGDAKTALEYLLRAASQENDRPERVDSVTQPEMTRVYLIAAQALSGDLDGARKTYQAYRAVWPNRTVWRQTALFHPAQTQVPHFGKIRDALAQAGMPRFADEHGSCAPPPGGTAPLAGAEFTPTPCILPGGEVVDTAALHGILAGAAPPLVLDVGIGMAVPPGALSLPPEALGQDRAGLEAGPAGERLRASAGTGIVVMDSGPAGVGGYNMALHLIALGYGKVLWYRGGEEAWAAAGLPAEDRRHP